MSNILEGLNEDQLKPVKDFLGNSLIIAGPGAGKTKTIISRSANMIHNGIDPSKIILFTFTNKAAKEIKDRVVGFIGKPGELITVGTYHSICARLLRRYANRIGYTNKFSIYDTEDTKSLLKNICKKYNQDKDICRSYISDCKNRGISVKQAIAMEQGHKADFAVIYREYQKELNRQDAMDFDDLIGKMIVLLETCPDVKEIINKKYRYIVADEAHDSSRRDLRLIKLLAGEEENVCLILDEDQSIYGFRGADIEAILKIDEVFPGIKRFVLRQNYRSTQSIVKASRSLISHNTTSTDKALFSENEVGSNPIYFKEYDQAQEASRVALIIKAMKRSKNLKNSDFCILYRMSFLSRPIEEAFIKAGIPYEITDGVPFCSRKEIKDILSYLRLLNNPCDNEAFKRAIGIPKRGFGEKRLEAINEYAIENKIDYLETLRQMNFTGKMKTSVVQFLSIMDNLEEVKDVIKPMELVKKVYSDIGYASYLAETEKEKTIIEDRLQNVNELFNIAAAFDTIEEFLETTSLKNTQNEDDDDKVRMMTQHASKGLEFKCVIIIGCNEGNSPHYKATRSDQIEEERRLFYVAMTRAEKFLFFTRPQKVMNQGRFSFPSESRFLREIDPRYLDKAD